MEPSVNSPLLSKEEEQHQPLKKSKFSRTHSVLGLLAVSAAVGLTTKHSIGGRQTSLSSTEGYSIEVVDPDYPQPSSIEKGIYPWNAVYAPHRVHELKLVGSKGKRVKWTISKLKTSDEGDVTHETVRSWDGAKQEHAILTTEAGIQHMITAVDESGISTTLSFISKHIRREIRSLSDEDRSAFLNSLATVMSTPTHIGRGTYGEDFFGGEWYTRWHMTNRRPFENGRIKSPWHGNPSFLTAHVAFTDYFERSLQAVNAKTAAHYYDYTIDGELLEDWTTSPIWSTEFFGEGSGNTYNVGGLWKDVIHSDVTAEEEGDGRIHNSYGILTMPYNNNPSMTLSRSLSWCGLETKNFKMPACYELKSALYDSEPNNIVEFYTASNRLLHGELHNLMGGIWSCPFNIQEAVDKTPEMLAPITTYLKEFDSVMATNYYDEKLACPDACTIGETAFEDCLCSCPDYDMSEEVSSDEWADRFEVLVGSRVAVDYMSRLYEALEKGPDGRSSFIGVSDEVNSVVKELCVKLLCSPPMLSDFATPYSSPNDPIFFPVHVSSERYWTYMRLVRDDPDFVMFDKAWNAKSYDAEGDDDTFVGYDFHDPMKPFNNAYGNMRDPAGTYYTNEEIMTLYSPFKEEVPYIFADLSWSHCD